MNIRKLILLVFTVCMAAFCYGRDTSSYNIKDLIPIARDLLPAGWQMGLCEPKAGKGNRCGI